MSEENGNQNPKEEGKTTKNMINFLKNKQAIKKVIIKLTMKILGPLIAIILLASFLFGIFNAVGDVVQNVVERVEDFFTIDHEGAIIIKDEQIDSIIDSIKNMGIDIDGLKLMGDVDYSNPDIEAANQEALREYIREFYQAQAMTQTLNTKPGWFENWTKGDKVYGTVYVYRTKENAENTKEITQLAWKEYNEFIKLVNSNNPDARKYFSINTSNGKLVYVNETYVTETTTYINETTQEGKTSKSQSKTIIELKEIDYQNYISQYTTSMNFFLYLAMISENPEFVSAVVDLVKNSEIRITLLDEVSITTVTDIYRYTINTSTLTESQGRR